MATPVCRAALLVAWLLPGMTRDLSAQVPFEQAIRDLASADASVRLRAARMLKEVAYPEAAVPLASAVTDPQDEVQLEAIAAELNIFLAGKIVPHKRVGLIIEVRNPVLAEAAFSAGPLAIEPRDVPPEVLTALRTASRDVNPRVALEALYTFGALAGDAAGDARRELRRAAGPEIAGVLGAADPAMRYAAVRVLGRLFADRAQSSPPEPAVGDAVIVALNDRDREVKRAAMQALGAMRYQRATQSLTDLFQYYGKGELAEAALEGLARIAHPSVASLLEDQLTSKSAAMRGIAMEGLARLGDPAALPQIHTAIAGERDDRAALARAFAAAMLSEAPLDPIAAALVRPRLRDRAKAYLVELAERRGSAFPRYLEDPDPRVRIDFIDALGLGGESTVLPLLEPMTKDSDAQVARAASHAIARLRHER